MSLYHEVRVRGRAFYVVCPRKSIRDPKFEETIISMDKNGDNLSSYRRAEKDRLQITFIKDISFVFHSIPRLYNR